MNLRKALEILRKLAEGIDPFTGEIFPPDSPYQNVQTVRALYRAIDFREKEPSRKTRPTNAGKPWSDEESQMLVKQYDSGMPIGRIAAAHQRTKVAIAARLVKLGKVESREQALTPEEIKIIEESSDG